MRRTFLASLFSEKRKEIKKNRMTTKGEKRKHMIPNYGRVPEEEIETKEKDVIDNVVMDTVNPDELQEEVREILAKMDDLLHFMEENKSSLEEKIHSENVKEYRNIQALIDNLERKMAKADRMDRQMNSMKTYLKCTTWFTVVNLLVLITYILFNLGVF